MSNSQAPQKPTPPEAESALRESEARLNFVLSATQDAIWDCDLTTKRVKHNHRWCQLLGFTEDSLEHDVDGYSELVHPDDRAIVHAWFGAIFGDNLSHTLEYRLRHANGHYLWVSDRGRVVARSAEGMPLRIVGAFNNVTQRREAEDEKFRLYQALRQSAAPTLLGNRDGIIDFVNAAFCQLFGYTEKELLGKHIRILVPPDEEIFAHQTALVRSAQEKGSWHGEVLRLPHDGVPIPVYLNVAAIQDNHGIIWGMVASFLDLRPIKKKQRALALSEERFELALAASQDALWDWNMRDDTVYLSPRYFEMSGYSPEEVTQASTFFKQLVHPDDFLSVMQTMTAHFQGATEKSHVQYRMVTRSGAICWVSGRGQVVARDANGIPLRMVGTMTDISERIAIEEKLRASESRFRTLFEGAQDGIVIADVEAHCFVDANPMLCAKLGYTRDELCAMGVEDIHPEKDVPWIIDTFQRQARGEFNLAPDIPVLRKDRSIFYADITVASMFIDGRQYLSGFFRDVTQRRHTEQQLRIAAVAFESQEGMLIADASCHILRVNRAFSDITGYAAKDAIGHSPKLLNATRHDEPLYETIWETATQTGEWAGEMESQRKNGETYFAHFTLTAVRSDRGLITHYVGTISDITERKTSSEKIRQLAFYDPLTHLPNRLLLTERLQHALETQARDGKGGALLFIDLDGFKSINDTLGHDMGDLLLQSVANRLMMCVRESDTVARLGGDEFIVMLEGFSGYGLEVAAQVEAVAHKILDTLNRPHHLGAHTLRSSCSIGVILFSDHAETQEELLKQADIAMYQAKKAGRNTLRFFDPVMQTNINARVSLENELHEALQHQQFELYYQIQVDSDRQSIGAEGLIRWHHPQLGLLQPMRFIPLAEESKLIVYIGKWVLETACAQLAAWQQDALTRHLVLSVNVSAQQFHQTSFVQQVHAAVQFHAIHPSRLKLELTESILLENINSTIATMNALKEIGIQFSLDDFGTGYSSLQYLKCLPINQLKIDQSFVRDIEFDNSDQVIVRTIIVMAQSLGLEVIAEGVENAVQERLLLQNGCTYYQGYRFSQPLPIAEFEALIQQNRSDAGFTPS